LQVSDFDIICSLNLASNGRSFCGGDYPCIGKFDAWGGGVRLDVDSKVLGNDSPCFIGNGDGDGVISELDLFACKGIENG